MDRVHISVCISVFNGEKHLERCLDSVVSQGIDTLEIVLVDDGSTDASLNIMREYKDRYPQIGIKVVEQEHSGLAQGRCTGVMNSSGEYVTFLDADDYLLEGAYSTVCQFMETNRADIYEFRTIRKGYYSKSPYSGIQNAKQVLEDYFMGATIPINYWLRLFRRELFTEQIFPKNISLFEDIYAFPCLLYNADTIAFIEKPLHVHTKEEASIMNSFYSISNDRDIFEKQKILLRSIPHIVNIIGREAIDGEYRDSFNCYKSRVYRDFLFLDVKGVSYKERLKAIMSTLNLKESHHELEKFIKKNIDSKSKTGRVIKALGLRNAYLLYMIGKSVRG